MKTTQVESPITPWDKEDQAAEEMSELLAGLVAIGHEEGGIEYSETWMNEDQEDD